MYRLTAPTALVGHAHWVVTLLLEKFAPGGLGQVFCPVEYPKSDMRFPEEGHIERGARMDSRRNPKDIDELQKNVRDGTARTPSRFSSANAEEVLQPSTPLMVTVMVTVSWPKPRLLTG